MHVRLDRIVMVQMTLGILDSSISKMENMVLVLDMINIAIFFIPEESLQHLIIIMVQSVKHLHISMQM